jgi:hypothetical protein
LNRQIDQSSGRYTVADNGIGGVEGDLTACRGYDDLLRDATDAELDVLRTIDAYVEGYVFDDLDREAITRDGFCVALRGEKALDAVKAVRVGNG